MSYACPSLPGVGKASRDKGATGEREFARLAYSHGVEAVRTAGLQAGRFACFRVVGDVTLSDHPQFHLEVKRDERMSVDAMVRQAERDCPEGSVPVVAYRRNRQPWRVVLPADYWLENL